MNENAKGHILDYYADGKSYLGQSGIIFNGSNYKGTNEKIDRIKITDRYGRFGNNYYQIMNAVVIALGLGIEVIEIPDYAFVIEEFKDSKSGIRVTKNANYSTEDTLLSGTFYAPFGFEGVYNGVSTQELSEIIRDFSNGLFIELDVTVPPKEGHSIALHFRGGDIFTYDVHGWYVQPPASFYLKSLIHALSRSKYDSIKLIYEDRENPTIETVESYLDIQGIPYISEKRDLASDINSILAADTIVASHSSFIEAISLMSSEVKRVYNFRSHASQIDFHPFLQTRFPSILGVRGVELILVDDMTCCYIPAKSWANTASQRKMMTDFDIKNLRLYETKIRSY